MEIPTVAIKRKLPQSTEGSVPHSLPYLLLLVFANLRAKVLSKVTTAIWHGDAEKYFRFKHFVKLISTKYSLTQVQEQSRSPVSPRFSLQASLILRYLCTIKKKIQNQFTLLLINSSLDYINFYGPYLKILISSFSHRIISHQYG